MLRKGWLVVGWIVEYINLNIKTPESAFKIEIDNIS
jgi:hypothetical protein